jgi:cytochrome c-type biogenesis protein CcmF
VIVLVVSFGLFMVRGRYQMAEEAVTSTVSRESLFIWNNVLFTVATAVVLLGTLYPLALETVSGDKITVGPQYFNLVMVPIFLIVLMLMAVAPLVPWRKANLIRLRERLLVPVAAGVGAGILQAAVFGVTPWTGPAAVALIGFVLGTLLTDYARAVRQRRVQQRGESIGRAMLRTLLGSRRHYGGMLVHFGVIVIAVGLVGSGLFKEERAVGMAPGEIVEIGGERMRFEGVREVRRHNYVALQGRLTVLDRDIVLTPERRQYPVQEAPTTESSIHSTPLRDLYAVIGEQVGPPGAERYAIHVYVFPFAEWLWYGGVIMVLGVVLSLSNRVRRRVPAELREGLAADAK